MTPIFQQVLDYLEAHGPTSGLGIAAGIGKHRTTTSHAISTLMADDKLHRPAWEPTRRQPRPLYAAGPGENVPPPPAASNAERSARLRARRNGLTPEEIEVRLAMTRARSSSVPPRVAALQYDGWTNMLRALL